MTTDNGSSREVFAGHAALLSRVLEALVLLTLLAGAIPFALAQPVWWLRLSDSAVNLAPMLLLAVILLRLSSVFLPSESIAAAKAGRRSFRLASRWAIVYGLMVPLQVIGFAWLWFDSDRQIQARIALGEAERGGLQRALIGASSEPELQALLARSNPGPMPQLTGGSLADRKLRVSQAMDANWAALKTNLSSERTNLLRNSFPGTLRVLLAALIISAFLFSISWQI